MTFGPLIEAQLGLSDFNPFQRLWMTCEILFDTPEVKEHWDNSEELQLALNYLKAWDHRFTHGSDKSRYASLTVPIFTDVQSLVRQSVDYLFQHQAGLGFNSKSDYEDFSVQLNSEISRVANPEHFADGDVTERGANIMSWSAVRLIGVLRDGQKNDARIVAVLTAILTAFYYYGSWLDEVYGRS